MTQRTKAEITAQRTAMFTQDILDRPERNDVIAAQKHNALLGDFEDSVQFISATHPNAIPHIGDRHYTRGVAITGFELPEASSTLLPGSLTYSVDNLPPGLAFSPVTRIVSGTPTTNGSYTITYHAVSNQQGINPATAVFTIVIANPPLADITVLYAFADTPHPAPPSSTDSMVTGKTTFIINDVSANGFDGYFVIFLPTGITPKTITNRLFDEQEYPGANSQWDYSATTRTISVRVIAPSNDNIEFDLELEVNR